MSELLLRPGEWQSTNACVAYSFFASVGIMLGLSQKHKDFIQKVYDSVFYSNPAQGSIEYQMLESLGRLPLTYVVNEMKSFSTIQKKQVKIWYEEVLALEPQMEINPFLSMMLQQVNPIINNF